MSPQDAARIAAENGLQPIGVRPPLRAYVRALRQRRQFTHVLASSKAYAENQGTYLGQLWSVLTPTMNALVYVMIFGLLLKTNRGVENVIGFIVVGVFVYRLFDEGVGAAARSIPTNGNLVRALQFPRVVLPTAGIFSKFLGQLPSMLVMLVFVLLSRFVPRNVPVPVSWRWLLLPVAILLLLGFSLGVGYVFARICAGVPDLLNFFPFVFRILMYASGVIFPINHYVHNAPLERVLEYQPVALYLDLARQSVLHEPSIPLMWSKWLLALAWSVGVLLVGFVFFWRAEARYGRE
jgi:teichoic acid transport system permease protein